MSYTTLRGHCATDCALRDRRCCRRSEQAGKRELQGLPRRSQRTQHGTPAEGSPRPCLVPSARGRWPNPGASGGLQGLVWPGAESGAGLGWPRKSAAGGQFVLLLAVAVESQLTDSADTSLGRTLSATRVGQWETAGCSAEHCAAAAAAGQLEARLLLVWHSSADEIHPRRTALDSSRQAGQNAIGRNGDDGGGGPRGAIDYAGQYYGAWAVAPPRCAAGTRALQGLWLRSLDSVDRVTISHPDRAGPGRASRACRRQHTGHAQRPEHRSRFVLVSHL